MGIKKRPTTNFDDPVNYSAGEYNAVTPTLNDGDVVSFQFDNSGNLMVKTVNTGSGSNPAAGATASAVPADADYQGVNVGGNLTGVTGLSVGTKVAPTVAIVDASGNQITAFGGSGGNAAASNTGSAVPAAADYTGFNSGGNLVGVSSANPLPTTVSGALPAGTNVLGHVIADSGSTTAVTSLPAIPAGSSLIGKVGIDQTTPGTTNKVSIGTDGTVAINAALPAGTNVIGHVIADSGSTTAVTSLPSIPAGSNLIGTVQPVPATTGGMSFFTQSLTSTKAQVKGSAGTLYGITAVNNGSAIAYVQVFNKASASVTVGTTAPDYVVPVPAPSSGTAGAGIREEYSLGMAFGTGITVACTTTRTGSTSATCDVNVNYI